MKFLGPDLLGRSPFRVLSVLLLPGLLVVGCVSLTKPDNVTRNCPTGSAPSCSNNKDQQLPPDDAKKDMVVNPDQPSSDDTPTSKSDAGLDVPTFVPDSSPDKADSVEDNKDTPIADSRNPADVTDAPPPPADQVNGAEPGPEPPVAEPGPEPQNGPEPGKEPGVEPGPELGPEPGPEPQRDGGTDTTPASNCTIVYGSAGTGHPPAAGTTGAFCVATCDDIAGWGCSNFAGRTVTVNGTVIACVDGTQEGSLIKKSGYNVFQVSGGTGTSISATVFWWGTYATSCPAPDGGVFP